MRKVIFIILVFSIAICNSQPPIKFHQTFGSQGIDVGYAVLETLDKQYLVLGTTSSFGNGNTDIILLKVDTMGNVLWNRSYGGMQNDCGKAIVQLPDSSIVFTGFTNSFGNGGYDAFVLKTDKKGNQIWLKTFGGQDWDFAYDIIKMNDGNIIICGKTFSFGKGKSDGMVIKFDTSGNVIWNKYFGGAEDDDLKGIHTKNGIDFYVAGITRSHGDLLGDMLMYKLDNSGDSLMRIIYGGPQYDMSNDVTVASNDDILIAGGSESFTNGKEDAFVVRFTSTGTYLRKQWLGEVTRDEEITKVIPANSTFGDIVIIYSSDQGLGTKLDFLTCALDNGLYFVSGGQNGSFGSSDDEEPYDIHPTKDKGYIQIGYTKSFNALDQDMLFVKRDSMMRYGNYLGNYMVGLRENSVFHDNLYIYPNPATDKIYFTSTELERAELSVYDIQGALMLKEKLDGLESKSGLDISRLKSGVYIMRLNNENSSYYIKFTKL